MLTRRSPRRSGLTLIEMMISIAVAGVVLAMVAAISLRQQRVFADLADRSALAGQLREASAILPIDLRAAAAAAGDIRDARDSSLEIRATIASAVVCDTAAGAVVLAPAVDASSTLAGVLTPIEAGDTAWILSSRDMSDTWQPYQITAVGSAPAGPCAALGPVLSDSARTIARLSLAVAPGPLGAIGMPARITRPMRYSVYRASDGAWYLGEKDWNAALARFNTIQPVAGPFLAAASGGVAFRYFDSAGVALPVPVSDPRAVALIRVELRGQTKSATRVLGAAGTAAKRGDSSFIVVSLRNRR